MQTINELVLALNTLNWPGLIALVTIVGALTYLIRKMFI